MATSSNSNSIHILAPSLETGSQGQQFASAFILSTELLQQPISMFRNLLEILDVIELTPDLTEILRKNLETLQEGRQRLYQAACLYGTVGYYIALRDALECMKQSSYPEQINHMFFVPEVAHEKPRLTETQELLNKLHSEIKDAIEFIKPYTGG